MTSIPARTLAAYRRALYRVEARPRGFTLRVGKASSPLAKLLAREGAASAAFLTACNPRGKKQPTAFNRKAQAKLTAEVRRRGLAFFMGVGEDPDGKWAGEASLLILAIPLKEARALGRRFRQNALIFAGKKGVPSVILLR